MAKNSKKKKTDAAGGVPQAKRAAAGKPSRAKAPAAHGEGAAGGDTEAVKKPKALRKAEKRAAALAAVLEKVRKKAAARIDKAQQTVRRAEKRARKARAAAGGDPSVGGAASSPLVQDAAPAAQTTVPVSPTPSDPSVGVPAGGPDYAGAVGEQDRSGSVTGAGRSTVHPSPAVPASEAAVVISDVVVPEAITPASADEGEKQPGRAEPAAQTGPADDPSPEDAEPTDITVPEAIAPDGAASPPSPEQFEADASPAGVSTPVGSDTAARAAGPGADAGATPRDDDARDHPNMGWTLTRLRAAAKERGVIGYGTKSKRQLLDALDG